MLFIYEVTEDDISEADDCAGHDVHRFAIFVIRTLGRIVFFNPFTN